MKNTAVNETYENWLNSPAMDDETRRELLALEGEEITERFYKKLSFGTGGIRGIMGAGTNRLNRYTAGWAFDGLARQLLNLPGAREQGVVIACDTRNHSMDFARRAEEILLGRGIRVLRFDRPVSTPVLSFAVVHHQAAAGLMITASHNPKIYNGIKVYDAQGVQLTPHKALALAEEINAQPDPLLVEVLPPAAQAVSLGDETLSAFVSAVLTQSRSDDGKKDLSIVYTPLHGAALEAVTCTLKGAGFEQVALVQEQTSPDGDFPTVASPNPEERGALQLGLNLAEQLGADLVLGTDPDGDRLGAGVRHGDEYRLLTGNQIGALLVDFVLKKDQPGTLIKTVVTGELGAKIAESRGVQVKNTLTGFKYIGEEALRVNGAGEPPFVMGYEESYGYLVGLHARDKDATVSALLLSELAAREKARGRTLVDRLEELYQEFGFYADALFTLTLQGKAGEERIAAAMEALRRDGGRGIPEGCTLLDYEKGIDGLPRENVLKFVFADGSWLAARPSGTEPKIKFYASIAGEDREIAWERLEELKNSVLHLAGLA
ncbi:MAG: phospho-sugar mutase [Clostridia bacterium]|nr:phospho-sugar mutase [Clostridia bacterium]